MRIKILVLFLILILLYKPTRVLASDFNITSNDSYEFSDRGVASVKANVVITNKTKFVYAPSYSINTSFTDISDVKAVNSAGISLKTEVNKDTNISSIDIIFPKKLFGVNKQNKFTVTYTTSEIAKQTKNGWEIVIPGLSSPNTFSNYTVKITIPDVFGDPVIITPLKRERIGRTYVFHKDDFIKSGIYMLFKKGDPNKPKQKIVTDFPSNVIMGFPITGAIKITNISGDTITDQELIVESTSQKNSMSYKVSKIDPYETLIIPISLDRTPFLTMNTIKVKISFNGTVTQQNINVGLLPDLYLIILGGIITFGSIIVAIITWKTWRIYIQKR